MTTDLADDVGFEDDASTDATAAPEQSPAISEQTGTALVVQKNLSRIKTALADLDRIESELPQVESQFPKDVVYEITTTKGMKAAIEHRAAWRDRRITVEKARTMAKAPILELGRTIDARAKRLTEQLRSGEEPIDQLIKAEEQRKEDERQARVNAEAGRVLAIQEALAEIGQDVQIACGKSSADIQALLERMRTTEPDKLVFQEMIENARAAWAAGIDKLETALKAKLWDEEQEAQRAAAEAERVRRLAEEDAQRARIAAEQAAEAARLAAQQQALEIGQRAMAMMRKPAAEIRAHIDRLNQTVYADGTAEIVHQAHAQALSSLTSMLYMARQAEALAAAQAAEEMPAPPVAPVADGSQDSDDAAAIPGAKAGQVTPEGDQPCFEHGREGMAPEACESAAGRGENVAPALATLPHHESPGVGPMGIGQPADAGPAGGLEAGIYFPQNHPNPLVGADAEEYLARMALNAQGGGSIETSEREAIEPLGLPGQLIAIAGGAQTFVAPKSDEVTLLLRDVLVLIEYLGTPFEGRFPTHPKPDSFWWAGLRVQLESIKPRVQYAVGIPAGEQA